MRSMFVLAAFAGCISLGSTGCEESSSGSGAGAAPSASAVTTVSSAAVTPAASGSAAPKADEKKTISVTAKSAEAKTALKKGWELYDNGRRLEALAECKKAVAADADFALGHTCVGWLTDGVAGQTELDKGRELAAKLPDAEKLFIEALAASRHLDIAKYVEDLKKVAEFAPDDYEAHAWAGRAYALKRDFAASEAAYRKVLELNPRASFAYAALAKAETQLRKYDEALASAKKYAEAAPSEASAHQAHASALLNLNKTKEAEEELVKAVALGPKVLSAYDDLARVKTIQGDFAGARDVLEKSKIAETEPDDGVDRSADLAWVSFAEGKDADALKQLDAAEKDAEKNKLPSAGWLAITRARALWVLGKGADSLKVAEAGFAKCDARAESAGIEKGVCRINLLIAKGFAEVQLGKVVEAQKTVAQLRDEAKKLDDVASVQVSVDMLADQVAALDKKDKKAAAGLLAKCLPDDILWKLSILRMADKDGDKATGEQVRKEIAARPVSNFAYPLIAKLVKK